MFMEHFLCAQPRVSHWGCRDKSNSPHLPGSWSLVEKINKQADNDRIAFVLKKCSLADLCFENTELVREEYQKDYMLTEVEHSNSKEMEEGSQEHKRDYLRPCLTPCPVPNLRALFSPGGDVILWSLRWMWALAGAQGQHSDSSSCQVCSQGSLDHMLQIWYLLFCPKCPEYLMFRIRSGLFLLCLHLRSLLLALSIILMSGLLIPQKDLTDGPSSPLGFFF